MTDAVTRADGHGHPARGRFPSGDEETRAAMRRLLELGRVDARECWTELEHGKLLHLEAGAGPGAPIVLVQGAGGGAANWYRVLGPLGQRRRTLAPELPGFGLSDPAEDTGLLGVAGANALEAWLDAVTGADPVDMVATSFGGLVALRLAARGRVRRLVLLNSVGLGRGIALSVRLASIPVLRRTVESPSRAGTRVVFRVLLTSNRTGIPKEHEDALVEYAWRSAQRGAAGVLARTLPRFVGLAGQREVLTDAELGGVCIPVMVLWGSADRFLPPRHGARAARRIPGATWLPLPDIGHSPNWESPAQVLQAIGPFLDAA